MRSLTTGTTYSGFTVTDELALPELSGIAYVMRHDLTGARALWIATEDENKSFAIAFRTPPANDTGVFHILEHSVLCGSERYPVKEPFVNLLKTSMQTFLNALTFADKTMYPVASTNTADLENLMGVYLDAVLHPAIYTRPRIFEQEGWHYEVDEQGHLVYNGVVFNEMKGATSDPDDVLFLGLDRALFPNTAYRFESGGDPRAIPTLTYEEFIDNHRRHYNLANSYTILYGDMDIERELAFVGERFEEAASRETAAHAGGVGAPNPLEVQGPVRAGFSRVEMATAPENASVALAYVIGTADQRERVLAADVLLDALAGSNEAPLKRAVLDADLGDDFNAILVDGELQPRVVFQLKGAKEGVAERFRTLVEDTCRRLSSEGIPRAQLAASLAQAEFNLREQDFGSYPAGIMLSMQVMASWLYDDARPVDYLRFEEPLEHMKSQLDANYFEHLLASMVCDSDHCAEVELVPVAEGAGAEEAAELEAALARMDEADVARIRAEVEELRREQEAPDSPEDLAKLPQLGVDDIDDAKEEPQAIQVAAPLPCIAHELDTRRIDYVYLYFSLRHLAFEDLPYVGVLSDLLCKLATRQHSAAELDTLLELNLGSLSFFTETHNDDENPQKAESYLVVGASALAENVAMLATLPQEVWGQTLFDDTDRILAILQQRRISLEQRFVNAGHATAMARISGQYLASAKIADVMGGVDYYRFLKQVLVDWPASAPELVERVADVSRRVFARDNVQVSFIGPVEDRTRYWDTAQDLGLEPLDTFAERLEVPDLVVRNEAFAIPSNVSYVGWGSAPSPCDKGSRGTWFVAQRVLSYDYLWNEVRVKGGAYGTGFRRTDTGLLQYWSYRDPGIDATLARYQQAAAWLTAWQPGKDEVDGYVVSTVAAHDTPQKPRQLARRQDTLRMAGKPANWRDLVRAQELATTADDIRALADSLADRDLPQSVVVFGPREAIEASSVEFDEVIDLMG